jgi:hypothetical protein
MHSLTPPTYESLTRPLPLAYGSVPNIKKWTRAVGGFRAARLRRLIMTSWKRYALKFARRGPREAISQNLAMSGLQVLVLSSLTSRRLD